MKKQIQIEKATPNVGALDFSHLLDAPAGKHGFTQVKNGHLYFEDGTRVRFFGFNLPTRSNTPDHETAERLAKRFASLGVNVIRLHAMDCTCGEKGWSSSMDNPIIDYASGSSRNLHPDGMERFDYFVAKLKEAGIYIHLDLWVARIFQEGDGLDYPDAPQTRYKCFTHFNGRMIELQKEYAEKLLCHVNPYTGLALIDDPAVMTIQISNENSMFGGTEGIKDVPGVAPYRQELQERFNHFLLAKYGSRKYLAKAWTHEGVCVLEEEEDPERGTVRFPEFTHEQTINDPNGEWSGPQSPARYADFAEFAMETNRRYYGDMLDFIRSLGAKVPVATSNLLNGAADVYSHNGGDIMENNTYFNHPIPPFENPMTGPIRGAGLAEYVTTNPIKMHKRDGMFLRTTLLTMGSTAVVEGKPFILSEWNEYGLYPFHSTSFLSTIAYACLNDWDGLIIYCFHTSENWDDQPADRIVDVFDAYNDPSLICQMGFLASVFLQGLVRPADHRVDLVHTQNDLKTLPPAGKMPHSYLPYVTGFRNVFLTEGEQYRGDADVAVTCGFLNNGELRDAKHAVYYAWSQYRDVYRKNPGTPLSDRIRSGEGETLDGAWMNDQMLVFPDIAAIAGDGDYSIFVENLDAALKKWRILPEGAGLVGDAMISDTGELRFDPEEGTYQITSGGCAAFSGNPEAEIQLTDRISLKLQNHRITALLLPDQKEKNGYLLTMFGDTGMDETTYTQEGFFVSIDYQGKLYADTAEGELLVAGKQVTLTALDINGNPVEAMDGIVTEDGFKFMLGGETSAVHYYLTIEE